MAKKRKREEQPEYLAVQASETILVSDKARARKTEQPRGLSNIIEYPEQPSLYRASIYLEQHKFWNSNKMNRRARQLALGELIEDEAIALAESAGADWQLSLPELRAIQAIQILLEETNYLGHHQIPVDTSSSQYKWQGALPILQTDYSSYFEAYGLRAIRGRKAGRYAGRQREEALEALNSLTESRQILYRRKVNGKESIVRVRGPLLIFADSYDALGLSEQDLAKIESGAALDGRESSLVIMAMPLLVDGIANKFFVLKPTTLQDEIKGVLGARRISRAVYLFMDWLLLQWEQPKKISKEYLMENLGLDYLIKQRHRKRAESRLQEAIDTALEMELLLSYEEDELGQFYIFTLNPKRCHRLKVSQPKKRAS